MTKRTVVLVFCDLAHEQEVEAETVTVSTGRETAEVDLCVDCRNDKISPLLSAGRVVRKPGRKPRV
jgi:hypothetical protein